MQLNPQASGEPEHDATPFAVGAGQTVEQFPQLVIAVELTQDPLQSSSVGPPSPASLSQATTHVPPG